MSMRVITGSAKGRRLTAPSGKVVRPATDRLKGSLFNILFDVEGDYVVDLFAGSGSLAIEALSRGARQAVLVDDNAGATQHQQRNLDVCGLADRARMCKMDVNRFLRQAGGTAEEKWDLVFIDPPYDLNISYLTEMAVLLSSSGQLGPTARLVFERRTGDGPPPLPQGFGVVVERAYGQTTLYVMERVSEEDV